MVSGYQDDLDDPDDLKVFSNKMHLEPEIINDETKSDTRNSNDTADDIRNLKNIFNSNDLNILESSYISSTPEMASHSNPSATGSANTSELESETGSTNVKASNPKKGKDGSKNKKKKMKNKKQKGIYEDDEDERKFNDFLADGEPGTRNTKEYELF